MIFFYILCEREKLWNQCDVEWSKVKSSQNVVRSGGRKRGAGSNVSVTGNNVDLVKLKQTCDGVIFFRKNMGQSENKILNNAVHLQIHFARESEVCWS